MPEKSSSQFIQDNEHSLGQRKQMAGAPSPQTVSSLLILAAVFHAFAVILTSFRLWFRYHIRRLWWDDFWAALAFLCEMVNMVAQWTLVAPLDNPYTNIEALPTHPISRNAHIISFWLNLLFYTSTIWFSRISIVCSVSRIVPPARNVRLVVSIFGGLFICMWIYMFISKSVFCAVNTSWNHSSFPVMCPMSTWIAISEVCTDALSDIILVALPMRLLWRVRLPSNERIMILSVFSTSILVSVISAVHTSYLIPELKFTAGATAELEGAVSLIVCNLLVVVTFIYRISKNGQDLTAGISGGKHMRSAYRLTTVDLDYTGGSLFASTTIDVGTTAGTSATAFSGTNTNISTVVFAHPDEKNTTFGSVVEPDRSGLYAIPVPVPVLVRGVGATPLPISMTAKR